MAIIEKLEEGKVVLRTVSDSPVIHWLIKLPDTPNGYDRSTTGTADVSEARKKALDRWQELKWQHSKGMATNAPTFGNAARAYIKHLEHLVNTKQIPKSRLHNHKGRLELHLIPHFEKTLLPDMRQSDVIAFHQQRLASYHEMMANETHREFKGKDGRTVRQSVNVVRAPTSTTHANDEILIRNVFEYALLNRMIRENDMLRIEPTIPQKSRRGDFGDDWERLETHLWNWCEEMRNNPRIHFERSQLRLFAHILVQSGPRPNELYAVRWNDIRMPVHGNKVRVLMRIRPPEVPSKKHRPRDIVCMPSIVPFITELRQLHTARFGKEPDGEDFLFRSPRGDRLRNYVVQFGKVLATLGLGTTADGLERSAYSLRHEYATRRLLEGVNIQFLAQNMGTSVAMLEQNYGHVMAIAMAEELTKHDPFYKE